jgi:hypothetical protein
VGGIILKLGRGPADLSTMRVIVFPLLFLAVCRGQRGDDQITAVLEQMEHAEQTGDANALIGLFSRAATPNMEKMRPYIQARPNRHYHGLRTYVQGDHAALLAQADANSFVSMILVNEDSRWKIDTQLWSDYAPDGNAVYAMVPPEEGSFSRAGSPWENVTGALKENQAVRQGWQMRTTFDESFLYLRWELKAPLPAPGSTVEKPPSGWPVMKIDVAGTGEFLLYSAVNIGDQATFDQNGRANSHRPFASYSLRLERNHQEIFSTSADLKPSPLVRVRDRFIDLRIPLQTMGIADSRGVNMVIGDAQWPNSGIVSVAVVRYGR